MWDRSDRSSSVRRLLAVALVVPSVVIVAASCVGEPAAESQSSSTSAVESTVPREPVTHEFVIPAGTAVRIANDEDVGIIPSRIEVHVGDRIRVRNDDTELVRLGIFDVKPGETVSMNFNTAGQLEGVIFADEAGGCGVPPAEAETFVIDILD